VRTLTSPSGQRYDILDQLGAGGFGVTWRARREDGRIVAIKKLRIDRLKDWKAVELFEREARVLRRLEHPHIPNYLESFTLGSADAPEGFVLVQEYIEGETLAQRIERLDAVPPDEMTRHLAALLDTLSYLHAQHPPVVHRDLNPRNVIIADGVPWLIDFGAVQAVIGQHTLASTSVGSFGFAPMEQFIGRAVPASDLYSLAVTYVVAVTGRSPDRLEFRGNRLAIDASLEHVAVPPEVRRVLHEMTHIDSEARPRDARAAARMLREATTARPSAARPSAAPRLERRRAASGPSADVPTLTVRSGPGAPASVPLSAEKYTIGRLSSADILLEHQSISRLHAVLERTGDGYTITDLGSAGGTSVNGRRIARATLLRDGDRVEVGAVSLSYGQPAEPASADGSVRCTACGHDHPAHMRFCASCGATLMRAEAAGATPSWAKWRRPQRVGTPSVAIATGPRSLLWMVALVAAAGALPVVAALTLGDC